MVLVNIFKGSIIIRFILGLFKSFEAAYDNSRLKRLVGGVSLCFKSSVVYGILSRYVNKKPYYRYSLVYRFVMGIAALFDRLFALIHRIGSALLKGSVTADKVNTAIKSPVTSKLCGFGLLFMSIPIGSIISMIFSGSVTALNMVMCWAIFAFGFALVLVASCNDALKNSVFIKAISKFLYLIR